MENLFKEWFYYDESSPTFLRLKKTRVKKNGNAIPWAAEGCVAGVRTGGRIDVRLFYKLYKVHRVIYELMVGRIPDGFVVDHVDGDFTNNKYGNLRAVPQKINMRNTKKRSTNSSGKTGVFRFIHKKSGAYWRAFWVNLDTGKEERKDFSVAKFTEDGAKLLAENLRDEKMLELNNLGANFTERHGK
jgi:hypothetical protein